MKKKRKAPDPIPHEDFLDSGSTELNLASTGEVDGCFAKGFYYLFVGDSSSGKTRLALTCLAEAAINPAFDKYELIDDDIESGNLFNIRKFWPALASRIKPPRGTRKNPQCSSSVEEMYDNLNDAMDRGPCIYVVDSMDGLVSEVEVEGEEKNRAARRKRRETGKGEVKGSYQMTKQKANSSMLRRIIQRLRKTGSILIIICQTRDAINSFGWGETKTRGGGHALRFYATLEFWSSIIKTIKKKVRGKDRKMGVIAQVRIKKNRVQGKDRSVTIPLYYTTGIDDTGGLVDYLVEEGHWKKSSGNIKAPEFDFKGDRESLVEKIEEDGDEQELKMLVKTVWDDIESKCSVRRKNRYERKS